MDIMNAKFKPYDRVYYKGGEAEVMSFDGGMYTIQGRDGSIKVTRAKESELSPMPKYRVIYKPNRPGATESVGTYSSMRIAKSELERFRKLGYEARLEVNNAGTSECAKKGLDELVVNSTDKVVANALKHAARVAKNSDAGNCNSCANGCKGHKCSLGLSTKVAMNSGRKCQAWRADSLTRAVKRVFVNAKDWVGKTIKVGDKVTPAGSLKGRIFEVLEVYRGDRVKVRMDNGREMNMLSNGLFVTNSVEVKNMSAETAISRIEWMLGSTNRQERDEAASELEYYRDLIISRAGRAKYDEMMRRACNGEAEEV